MGEKLKKTDRYKPTKEQTKKALVFAIENKCVIDPYGWGRTLEGYNEFGHCICDKARPNCPCDQAAKEIEANGRCCCGLYWKSYEVYMVAKGLRNGR